MTRNSVYLEDRDLALLVGSNDPDVRVAAEQACARLAAAARWPELQPHVAALVVDVLAEARKSGRLIHRGVAISRCHYCGAHSTWEKSKRRRREYEAKISGIELADRFVIIAGHISVGGCRACFDAALATLRTELAMFPVELPQALLAKDARAYRRWDRCRCKRCDWRGHDGQLGKLPALMGGEYHGKCPSCGAERRLFDDPFERLDGFDVIETPGTP